MTIHGILPINKPKGKTSFYLVHVLRKIFNEKCIGHAGTLDPFATGVMILLIGRPFTKKSDQFLGQEKEYVTRLHLGITTDSYDCDGVITDTNSSIPTLEQIELEIAKFQGRISQIPPMFSAKKINGKKLYELARNGIEIERQPVELDVETKILSYNYPYLDLKIRCSKGTYIRSIGHDLGKNLGCGAHLIELTRTRSGIYTLEECLDWNQFSLLRGGKELFSVDETGNIRWISLESLSNKENLLTHSL